MEAQLAHLVAQLATAEAELVRITNTGNAQLAAAQALLLEAQAPTADLLRTATEAGNAAGHAQGTAQAHAQLTQLQAELAGSTARADARVRAATDEANTTSNAQARLQLDQLQSELARVRKPIAKVNPPAVFSGAVGHGKLDIRHWLAQVNLVIISQATTYTTDEEKINYAISWLRDDAFVWVFAYLQPGKPKPSWLLNFDEFCKQIQAVYGDPDIVQSYSRKLEQLRQVHSAASYAAEFRALANYLSWGDDVLMYIFKKNLKAEVKQELYRVDKTNNLNDLITLACNIDNNLHSLRIELRISNPKSTAPSTPQANHTKNGRSSYLAPYSPAPGVTPMEIDATTSAPAKRGPLNDKQKAYRKENNLCMYCGASGHAWANCKVRPQKDMRMNTTSLATTQNYLATSQHDTDFAYSIESENE